ncbi:hypothetical protein A2154_00130 [Candidatus Gottesmanbacteria bacterium RBG_16_43_7]|uniref:Glycosyl transferase family 1 domain-containing protein n=1 Tax=Candidatus Gottesmanbacteria bacterium RBG_16_43_7 TaxID=1798373 RepID=A0A1F5ZC92_9BACT|nr:MAG: hypothetical protein A2154_00130 [Candidatus Gottesmanbacteria bacterium RBG_16_43_7]
MRHKSPRIGIIVDKLNAGGMQKIAIRQTTALQKSGVDAALVVLRYDPLDKNNFRDMLSGVRVIYLDQRLPRILRISFRFPVFQFFSLFHITYALFLPFVVSYGEFDYWVPHGTYTCFTAITIRLLKGIRFSGFIWDPVHYIMMRIYKHEFPPLLFHFLSAAAVIIDRLICSFSEFILVGGSAHNSYFKKIAPQRIIRRIPPPVIMMNGTQTRKDKSILLSTVWKKGKHPKKLIAIVRNLKNVHFVMSGAWICESERKDYTTMVKKTGLSRQITVTGEISDKNLFDLNRRCLAVLQINDDRGFGLPALEAAACGTTFIIPRGQGVCEYFRNGIDGYFVTEGDINRIVDLIRIFIGDPNLAVTMGKSAQQRVMNFFSWRSTATALINLI